jgi:hypothetical protein
MKWIRELLRSRKRSVRPAQPRPTRLTLERLEDRTVPTELIATFQGAGVYRFNHNEYQNPEGWQQLTSVQAVSAAITESDGAGNEGTVVASFQGYGTYMYSNSGGWRPLTPAVASQVGIDGAYTVAEFPGQGVWRYAQFGGWTQLTGANANSVSVDGDGDVAAAFQGYGVYLYDGSTGHWQQLAGANASQVAVGDPGNVAAVFPGFGTYLYNRSSNAWQGLTGVQATSVAINDSGKVAASFAGYGTYLYSGSWQQLTGAAASQVAISGESDVGCVFPGSIWLWKDGVGQWSELTTGNNINLISVGK